MRRLGFIALGGLIAVALAACSGGGSAAPLASSAGASPGASPASAAACAVAPAGTAATVSATIKDLKFSPDPIEAKVGDVIAWANNDTVPHNVTLEDGSCKTDTISPGATASLVLSVAGSYKYKCSIHPSLMNGLTIDVK
jgi:plastocyanin